MRKWLQAMVDQFLAAISSVQETPAGRAPAMLPPMFPQPAFTITERTQILQTLFALLWQRNESNIEQCRLQYRDPVGGNARLANYWKQSLSQLVAGFPAWVNLSESSCLRGLLSFLTKIAQVSLVLIVDRRKDGSISTVAMDSHAFDLRTV